MNSDSLDHELAALLQTDPSGDLQARIRARVSAERIAPRWRLLVPAAAFAGLAAVVIVGMLWVNGPEPAAPMAPMATAAPAVTAPVAAPAEAAPASPSPEQVAVRSRPALAAARGERPAPLTAARRDALPEVLLPASERAGVRLLFDSLAAGEFELPERMLQESSVPVAAARPSLIPVIDPFAVGGADRLEGEAQ